MKLAAFNNARTALAKLLATELSFKVSYQLSKLQRRFEAELQFIDAERVKIFRRLGEDIGGGQLQIKGADNQLQAQREIANVLDLETTEDITRVVIPVSVLETVKLAPLDWSVLEPFLDIRESEGEYEKVTRS